MAGCRLVTGLAAVAAFVAIGCTSPDLESDIIGSADYEVVAPIPSAYCSVLVDGTGWVDTENDYLPRVIACENGAANAQALEAQAIAARSTAYYYMATSGSICDSQSCQVYTCGATPQAKHYQAVSATSGKYLMYNNTLTYGFYVAGDASTSAPSCVGSSGGTEGWVTYNQGQTGTNVTQTQLGWVHNPGDYGYGQNRGCMSQNGAKCLENQLGYNELDILRFYYGADIGVVQATGSCVGEPPPTGGPPAQATGLNPDGWVNVGSSSVYLTWNASSGATSYDVTFLWWDGAAWQNYYTWNTTNTNFTAWPVHHDTYYAWTVKAKNSQGQAPQSAWAYFYLD